MRTATTTLVACLAVAGCALHPAPRTPDPVPGERLLPTPPDKRPGGPGRRAELHVAKRMPEGVIELDPSLYVLAEAQAAVLPLFSSKTGSAAMLGKAAGGWEWMGPTNVAGRMRALAFHPDDPDRMFASGVSGGIWQTHDAGVTWQAMSDDAVNLNIGALAIDPSNPDLIYAGTGELYRNSERPYAAMWGQGILRSTDGGQTWPQLLSTRSADFRYVSDIVISHHHPGRIYAATNTGVWRSDDRGQSFVKVLAPTDGSGGLLYEGCVDLQLVPGLPGDHLLATCASRSTYDRYWLPNSVVPPACGGPCPATVFLSEDAAAATPQWQPVLSEPGMGRTELAMAPSNPAIVYAMSASIAPGFDRTGNGQGDYENGLHAIFRSDDAGRTWHARTRNSSGDRLSTYLLSYGYGFEPATCQQGNFVYGAGWYNMAITVHPQDPDVVWAAGMEIYRSDDGAQTFGRASEWWPANSPYYVHADVHALAFHPHYAQGRQQLFVATDGGLALTGEDHAPVRRGPLAACLGTGEIAPTWSERIAGLGTTQYYTGTVNADGSVVMGGLQDNGTQLWSGAEVPGAWTHILGGDGTGVAIDPRNDNVIYASSQNVAIRRSSDRGQTWSIATNGLNDTPIFVMPYVIDRLAPDRLYAGATRVWRTLDQGNSWVPASAPFGFSFWHRVSAIDVSPVDNNRVLAANGFGIHRSWSAATANGATIWPVSTPRAGWVSSLRFDPQAAGVAYATYSTFGGSHVWRSDDAGATWVPIDGDGSGRLPDVPVHDIAIHPHDSRRLYVATDIGVFVSVNGGASWYREHSGFANAIVERLAIAPDAPAGPTLHAFTYGRGVWRVALAELDGQPSHPLGADLSGTWFDPAQDGHGWLFEAIDMQGVLGVVATWYTYLDGQPVWLTGVAVADGYRVRIPLTLTSGGGFPPDFDPSGVVREPWGEVEIRFDTPERARATWSTSRPGFSAGSMNLERLVLPAAGGDESEAGSALAACHSGSWFQPAQDGHGLQLQIFGDAASRQAVVVWYAYLDGAQRWLTGIGPVSGDSAVVEMISADGAQFPPQFDPADVSRRPWGSLVFTATGADSARIVWTSEQAGFGSGELDLVRLTSMLGRTCKKAKKGTEAIKPRGRSSPAAHASAGLPEGPGFRRPAANRD